MVAGAVSALAGACQACAAAASIPERRRGVGSPQMTSRVTTSSSRCPRRSTPPSRGRGRSSARRASRPRPSSSRPAPKRSASSTGPSRPLPGWRRRSAVKSPEPPAPAPEPPREPPEPTPDPVPEPEPPSDPEPSPDPAPEPRPCPSLPPRSRLQPRLAAPNGSDDGARLVAMKMALDGASREDVAAHLADATGSATAALDSTTSSPAPAAAEDRGAAP